MSKSNGHGYSMNGGGGGHSGGNGNKESRPFAEQLKDLQNMKQEDKDKNASAAPASGAAAGAEEDVSFENASKAKTDATADADGDEAEVEIEARDEGADADDDLGEDTGDDEEEEVTAESDDEEDADADEEDVSFATTPFAGLIDQSLTVVVGIGPAEDVGDYNFKNPFSKKAGVAREFIAGIAPMMQELAEKDVMILTDNLRDAIPSLFNVVKRNAVKQMHTMFGNDEDSKPQGLDVSMNIRELAELDADMPSLNIDTMIRVNMPALTEPKVEGVIRNLFIYLSKLTEELPNIGVRTVFGFQTVQLIDADTRPAFDAFVELVNAENSTVKLVHKRNQDLLNDAGFAEDQIHALFEDFDLLFVKS